MQMLVIFGITEYIILPAYFVNEFILLQWTPLHVAAREDHDYTVKCLVQKGADISIKDKNGVGQTMPVNYSRLALLV